MTSVWFSCVLLGRWMSQAQTGWRKFYAEQLQAQSDALS
jgi:hypothetical protein